MPYLSVAISELDQGFLAGFLEGEACFAITEQNAGASYACSVTVVARDDDQELLEWLLAALPISRSGPRPSGSGRLTAATTVAKRCER